MLKENADAGKFPEPFNIMTHQRNTDLLKSCQPCFNATPHFYGDRFRNVYNKTLLSNSMKVLDMIAIFCFMVR
jgi:hypothetical protein